MKRQFVLCIFNYEKDACRKELLCMAFKKGKRERESEGDGKKVPPRNDFDLGFVSRILVNLPKS